MGLDAALSSALSSLRVNQESLAQVSKNISNANSDNFTRREIIQSNSVVAGQAVGVRIEEVRRAVDEFAVAATRRQMPSVGKAEIVNDYYERASLLFGQPGADNSLDSFVDNFFSNLSSLATSPEQASLRTATLSSANVLTQKISGLASDIETLRYEADLEINRTVDKLNSLLSEIDSLNQAIATASNLGNDKNALMDERDQLLIQVTEIIDVGTSFNSDGQVSIFIPRGELLTPTQRSEIRYNPAPSVDTLINGDLLTPIEGIVIDSRGQDTNTKYTLATGNDVVPPEIYIDSGSLRGLLELRDQELPRMLAQLDQLAEMLTENFNQIHNDGAGFPPPPSLEGTRSVATNEPHQFSGEVRIAVLTGNGEPISDGFGGVLPPLNLDLSRLDSGSGQGIVTSEILTREINQYFGSPPAVRTDIGGLQDLRIASRQADITPAGTFDFDFEFTNVTGSNITFDIDEPPGLSFSAPGVVQSGTFDSYTIAGGKRERTDIDGVPNDRLTMDLSGASPALSNGDVVTIGVPVRITNSDGDIFTDTISFDVTISGAGVDIRNQRYISSGISGSGDATQIAPSGGSQSLRAELVNENGLPPGAGETGTLRLTTLDGNNGIAIDELNSTELGIPPNGSTTATNRGFSFFFGLNDFFTNGGETKNSAVNFAIRDAYKNDPSKLATAELVLSGQPSDTSLNPIYSYEIGISSNQLATRLASLNDQRHNFSAAGTLSSVSTGFSGYSGEIIAFAASKAGDAARALRQEQTVFDAFQERQQRVGGVNVDEELANTILFQNNYTASARIVNIISDLFETLIDTF